MVVLGSFMLYGVFIYISFGSLEDCVHTIHMFFDALDIENPSLCDLQIFNRTVLQPLIIEGECCNFTYHKFCEHENGAD